MIETTTSTIVLATLGHIPISLHPTEFQNEIRTYSFTAPWKKSP